ncbi:PIR Superfamily Protein [Plasmodium ovale wallikeri]|uniref:PIR protein n=2 Tax=Plasmodium ovale TaxID=36330 RepID=A0A1C3KGG5_PLAOA|nr:PIR Superfamily Protein [Plasmodium ovale wallikeri]SBT72777.1 PIR protein [Plasmodium ovale]
MPLEIQTIYNAATLNDRYKEKLNSFKNDLKTKNINGCQNFNNQYLNTGVDAYKICEAVILFLGHLIEETTDTIYRDNGCKYLFYWLYTHVINDEQTNKNTLKLYKDLYTIFNEEYNGSYNFDNYINVMNENTIEKLVKLTNIYDKLDNFYEGKESPVPKRDCVSGVSDLYTKYSYECIKGYDYDFCDELKNFRKKHNFIIQQVLLCEGEEYLLPPVESFDAVNKTIIPFSFISISSLILPILYKFTPFGPWIRRLIGKNKNILENIDEETSHSLNTYEIGDDNSSIRDYIIAYNSS